MEQRTFESPQEILPYLSETLVETTISAPGFTRYAGKVRDSYAGVGRRILIASDRLSCFDKVVTTVPFKGQVLTQLALYWFDRTKDIVDNHLLEVLSPEAVLVREAKVLPIEVVIRAYLAGSAWRDYQAGKRISGVLLPPGLVHYAKLPVPIMTPSTKAKQGEHDEPISEQEVISRGLVDHAMWDEVREKAFALFERASAEVATRGLVLVDTKFEFGIIDGKVVLVDEVFTLDSSRYWEQASIGQSTPPRMLDKEPVRQWLLQQGYKGDGPIPTFSEDYRAQLAFHYIDSYKMISGQPFVATLGSASDRLKDAFVSVAA